MRSPERLELSPRFDESDVIRLNRRFRGASTREMLEAVIGDRIVGKLAVVSSFGAESAVLLHLIASIDPRIPVLFLETGKHFPETLEYRDRLRDLLGLQGLVNLKPDAQEIAARDQSGLRWSYDPDGCCELRKVRPLARALAAFDASFTGRKAFQSSTRANLLRFELDRSDHLGRLKINPLIDWSADDIAAYFAEHDLPRHPLVAQGFPSIGCSPCTHQVAPGEDPRSGRWKGWDKTECGIHLTGNGPDREGEADQGTPRLPPGYEPFL